jgi:soluble lytic murein transglycosylase-like protein
MAGCPYESLIRQAAIARGINPGIAVAQAMQESGCRPGVCSGAGACGIFQQMPGTAAQYGITDRFNPNQSIDGWARIMSDLLDRFNGDYRLALAGYHSGPGAAQKALNNCAGNPKTCNYVNSILGASGGASGGQPGAGGEVSPLVWVAIGIVALMALRG